MPGTSLLALLDDIASVLDHVATLTKVATKKTAGVLGDDLALNAQQVSGVRAERELPVVWAVAKGSALNKAILVPAALLISTIAPWAIPPLLMLGGAFLCFEGFEKIAHKLLHGAKETQEAQRQVLEALGDPSADLVALESDKIKGAVRTDFILSAEIITIALGSVGEVGFGTRVLVLLSVAVLMTVGVYGLVAGIVKLDDLGQHLVERGRVQPLSARGRFDARVGGGILIAAPYLMKVLSVAGTGAMFLVGGGILTHGIAPLHQWIAGAVSGLGGFVALVVPTLVDALVGVVVGAVCVGLFSLVGRFTKRSATV